jgi:hypothetical protein
MGLPDAATAKHRRTRAKWEGTRDLESVGWK